MRVSDSVSKLVLLQVEGAAKRSNGNERVAGATNRTNTTKRGRKRVDTDHVFLTYSRL
jgi:hypothetical protein